VQSKVGYINIHVRDFERAVAFYRDVLGFRHEFTAEDFQYARFDVGGLRVAVAAGHSDDFVGHESGDHLTGIGLVVDDVDAACREMKAKGARFTMEPSRQPWGGYMAMFADPDGNVFYLDKAE
jgi:predicted enzyme related to lactoylglutathione lyase